MGHTLQPRQAQKPAGALYGVNQAEDERQGFGIVRGAFKRHQRDIKLTEAFVGLGQKIGKQVVHCGPLLATRRNRVRASLPGGD